MDQIVSLTSGYSGSDLSAVCKEAAMGPLRELGLDALITVRADDVRPIACRDFVTAAQLIRPSVSPESLLHFNRWSEQFGVSR